MHKEALKFYFSRRAIIEKIRVDPLHSKVGGKTELYPTDSRGGLRNYRC